MSFNYQQPTDLPQNLLEEYSLVEKKFIEALQIMDPAVLEESFNQWDSLYQKILEAQPKGVRYHKGGEVHNMGMCKVYAQQALESLKYIEDLLSLPLVSANNTPGAKTLRGFFKLSDNEFNVILRCVEDTIDKQGIVQNPRDVFSHIQELRQYNEIEKKAKQVTLFIKHGRYPSVSHLPGEWEKRVFIGGDYESIYLLDAIIAPVIEYGFIPILATEFKTADEDIHHHSLLLLHNCKYAIFDVSSKGGHMMEAERTLDYGTITLFVCNITEQPRVSAMLKSLGKNYEIHWFEKRKELKKHIFEFLPTEAMPSKGIE